jgi:hypothetical protein
MNIQPVAKWYGYKAIKNNNINTIHIFSPITSDYFLAQQLITTRRNIQKNLKAMKME